PPLPRKRVGQERRRDRAVSRFTDADGGTGREERGEVPREAAERGGDAPDRDADREKPRPPAPISESAEDGRGQHVNDDEAREESAELGVRERQGRRLQALRQRRDHEPVEVVEEIDERQDRQREPGRSRRRVVSWVPQAFEDTRGGKAATGPRQRRRSTNRAAIASAIPRAPRRGGERAGTAPAGPGVGVRVGGPPG